MKTIRVFFIVAFLLWVVPAMRAFAHDPGLSTLMVRACPEGVEATLTLAIRDAGQLVELDKDQDGVVTQTEFAGARLQLEEFVAGRLVVVADGKVTRPESLPSGLKGNNNAEFRIRFRTGDFSQLEIQSKLLASLPPGHRQFLQVRDWSGKTVTEQLLSANLDSITVSLAQTARPAESEVNSCGDFVVLGVKHSGPATITCFFSSACWS